MQKQTYKTNSKVWFATMLIFLFVLFIGVINVSAASERREGDMTGKCKITCDNHKINTAVLADADYKTSQSMKKDTVLTVVSEDELINGIYIEFNSIPVTWQWKTDVLTESVEQEYYHQYVNGLNTKEVELAFPAGTEIAELYVIQSEDTPAWVEVWEAAPAQVDLLVFPTHYDDDQLYFAGMIPWALDQDAIVQVAFLVNHDTQMERTHEVLHGLWANGLRNYPEVGIYPDTWFANLNSTVTAYSDRGISWFDIVERQVALIRRYKPQVIATHAVGGEYGHGAHILYERICVEAAALAGDANAFAESAEEHGAWEIPKVYVHNYTKAGKPTILDLDTELETFDGKTAYQIAVEGFNCHQSQSYTHYYWWLNSPKSAGAIKTHSPTEWGLYTSTVGKDENKNSLFENIVLLNEQERLIIEAENEAKWQAKTVLLNNLLNAMSPKIVDEWYSADINKTVITQREQYLQKTESE